MKQLNYVKLYEAFLSEKEEKDEEEIDPGTALVNTTGIVATSEANQTKEDYVKSIKDSLEDHQSQGGKITKKVIKDSVSSMEVEDTIKQEVQTELEDIFL